MTRDEAVAILKQRMGNNQDTELDALIVTEMQLAQVLLEEGVELPWFLWKSTEVSESTSTPVAPDGFLRTHNVFPLFVYTGSKYIQLVKEDMVKLENYDFGTLSTFPTHYAPNPIDPTTLRETIKVFNWDLTTAYTLRWNGYYADDVLSTNIQNKWLKFSPDVLIAETGKIIAAQYNAFEKFGALFAQQAQAANGRLMIRNTEWEEANYTRIIGGGS